MLSSETDFDDDPVLAMEAGEFSFDNESTKTWPDTSFCQNALLSMIYRCREDDDLPIRYRELSVHLERVLDEHETDIERARSVRSVARWLEINNQDAGHIVWGQLAVDVGHPEAIYEQTVSKLSAAGYEIVTAADAKLLPSIQQRVGRPDWGHDPLDALIKHVSDLPLIMKSGAPGWKPSEIQASIQSIVLFFIFSIRIFGSDSQFSRRRASRFRAPTLTTEKEDDWAARARALRDQLGWLEPIWGWLIDEYARRKAKNKKGRSFDDERQQLLAQHESMKLFLKNLESAGCEADLWFQYSELRDPGEPRQKQEAPALEVREDQVVLVKGTIAPASEKWEVESLKRYSCLLEPFPLTQLPGLAEIDEITESLSAEFPWATDACRLITQELRARASHGSRVLSFSPVLLVGPPGSGKTRFAQRLGSLLGIDNSVINCAGMADPKIFQGLARGWASARPSFLVERLAQTKRGNHLFLLDEIDKFGSSNHNGDPRAAVLDLLEPGNAARYADIYLLAEVDLSHCLFVATANSLEPIPAPLLDRLQPIFFPQPGPEHAPTLIKGVQADLERSWGLPVGAIGLDTHQREILAGLPARQMKRAMVQLLAEQAEHRPGGMLPQ